MTGGERARSGVAQRPSERAGLVPSQTTVNEPKSKGNGTFRVLLDPTECALRRVNRLKKAVWASGHLHKLAQNGIRPPVCWFVTLTYRHANAWAAEHIKTAVNRFRAYCKRQSVPCRYTWVAEIQTKRAEKTGDHVVHYHLLAWLPVGVRMPLWDKPSGVYAPFWLHGMSNTAKAFSGIGYLMKYLSKLGSLSTFPKGLRLYGIGGLDEQARQFRTWLNLPEWTKSQYGVGDLVRRAGRFVVRATGEILAPLFRVSFVSGTLEMRPLREVPPRWEGGAYSTFPRA